jgi:hypothetical protein
MKFDGFSDGDDSRVVVRDCGDSDTNVCTDGSTWWQYYKSFSFVTDAPGK